MSILKGGTTVITRAVMVAVLVGAGMVAAVPAEAAENGVVQSDFAAAASATGVPEQVLLAVSYLASGWDSHAGRPSTTGGYGPMHLTDMTRLRANYAGKNPEAGSDARGDTSRPVSTTVATKAVPTAAVDDTLPRAASLLRAAPASVRTDPRLNVLAGATLLAAQARQVGNGRLPATTGGWFPAVKAMTGSDSYAADVFAVMRTGASRTTAEGHAITLHADASVPANLAAAANASGTECPAGLGCDFVPAAYKLVGDGTDKTNYGNYDTADRPQTARINTIVIHDTETSYADAVTIFQNERKYTSANYLVRSGDGHVTQLVHTKDVAWQAGNWYVNTHSVGIEHEGFADAGGSWYTEELYRSSARLVRYLAQRFGISMDRQHIYGHDTVPGLTAKAVGGVHWDPGAYWNWEHYFELLGAPMNGSGTGPSPVLMIRPSSQRTEPLMSCPEAGQGPSVPIPGTGTSTVQLHTAPSNDAPLISDPALHPDGSPGTTRHCDWGDKVSAGQIYAVADRQGEWTAIWYDGFTAWFQDSEQAPASVPTHAALVTPRTGLATIPVYGGAYPEADEFPSAIPASTVSPLQYTLKAGQKYAFGGIAPTEYYYAKSIDSSLPMDHTVVRGKTVFYSIQLGHRIGYVKASDVSLTVG